MMTETNRRVRRALLSAALVGLALGAGPRPSEAQTIEACSHNNTGNLRRVLSGEECGNQETAISWNEVGPQGPQGETGPQGPQGETGPAGPRGPAGADAVSPTFAPSCPAEVAHLSICQGAACHDLSWPCAPYKCDDDGVSCGDECASSNDCAQGAGCDLTTNRCAFQDSVCADAFTVKDASGHHQSCAPYVCLLGSCQQQCSGHSGCADGYNCSDGRCELAP